MRRNYLATLFILLVLASCSLPGFSIRRSESGEIASTQAASAMQATLPPAITPLRFPSCRPAQDAKPFQPPPASNQPTPATTSLRHAADRRGIFIGAAVIPENLSDPAYSSLLKSEFNMLVAENAMKWVNLHPEPNRYDFTQADALVEFALLNGMALRGHVLVWEQQLPKWVTEGKFNRLSAIRLLCRHIKTVVGHYRGSIYAWDVVNEAVNSDGTLRNTIWMKLIGAEYIAMAFQWAHEADPQALLFYNDNGGEGMNRKSDAIYQLVKGLLQSGVPAHGVGLQMHTGIDRLPKPSDLSANLQRLTELGLEIHITEMDVRLQDARGDEAQKLTAQAEAYGMVLRVCLSNARCKALLTWGLTDRYSWIPSFTGKPDAPLLFDVKGSPKPAYHTILELLSEQ